MLASNPRPTFSGSISAETEVPSSGILCLAQFSQISMNRTLCKNTNVPFKLKLILLQLRKALKRLMTIWWYNFRLTIKIGKLIVYWQHYVSHSLIDKVWVEVFWSRDRGSLGSGDTAAGRQVTGPRPHYRILTSLLIVALKKIFMTSKKYLQVRRPRPAGGGGAGVLGPDAVWRADPRRDERDERPRHPRHLTAHTRGLRWRNKNINRYEINII